MELSCDVSCRLVIDNPRHVLKIMIVTIQKATVLTGRSRSTITRHIKDGKLSKTGDGIDTSELLRVYGAFIEVVDVSVNKSSNNSTTTREDWLITQIDALNKQLVEQKYESTKREQEHLEREKRLMALLEHQTGTTKKRFGFF